MEQIHIFHKDIEKREIPKLFQQMYMINGSDLEKKSFAGCLIVLFSESKRQYFQ